MATPRELVLIDGHSLAYRAFYALPDTLRTTTGEPTNAVFGFTSMLIKLLTERQPDAIVVAFDKGRDEQRIALFSGYKAQRAAPPETFRPQVDLIRRVVAAFGFPIIEVQGVEADDLIATVATRATQHNWHTAIVTGDRDALQLVSNDVTVLYTVKGISELNELDADAVESRYGVTPKQYLDYAALRGDTSDNLPGVPGVGEKTAAKLLQQFGSIDAIYDNLESVNGTKVVANLREHEPQVRINQDVMRLKIDVDVALDVAALAPVELDVETIAPLFDALQFRSLYDRLIRDAKITDTRADHAPPAAAVKATRHDAQSFRTWLSNHDAGPIAVAVTSTADRQEAESGYLALTAGDGDVVVVDLSDAGMPQVLQALITRSETTLVTHDSKRLTHALAAVGIDLSVVLLDTQLAAYLLSPERSDVALATVVGQYLGRPHAATGTTNTAGQLAFTIDTDEVMLAVAIDAAVTFELFTVLGERLDSAKQRDLHDTIEAPLAPVLARMEIRGIAIDLTVLDELRDRLNTKLAALATEIYGHAGEQFNLASAQQLQRILFDRLDLPRTRKIKTGYSTDAKALSRLVDHHPIVPALLAWRESTKLLTTYVDALPPLVNQSTGRIHTTFSQTSTTTGRLSSLQPNLQNIPIRRGEGREIRRAFVPGNGYDVLLVADYSQIELRLLAHLSEDEGLLEAFAQGEDVHATTAAKVFDTPLSQVDTVLRDRAKAVNYGLAYGLTAFGLSQQLDIPVDDAEELVNAYFARFPRVKTYLEDVVKGARSTGYTTTLFGRRRYLPDLSSDNRNLRQNAERMALNAPIQGTAADIIKRAMIVLDAALAPSGLSAQLLLQVHDEVVLEVTDEDAGAAEELVVKSLRDVAKLRIPLDVDTASGLTWFDAQKH
ncbi:MAG: DNA polymerase I [Nitriliruptoraceae bacterium]